MTRGGAETAGRGVTRGGAESKGGAETAGGAVTKGGAVSSGGGVTGGGAETAGRGGMGVWAPSTWDVVGQVRAPAAVPGSDVALLVSGMMVAPALAAARVLRSAGIATVVLNIPVIKPLDTATVLAAAATTQTVITAENHSTTGGLGSAVAETLAEAALPRPLHRLGIQDTYAEGAKIRLLPVHQIRPLDTAPRRRRLVGTPPARHSPSLPAPPGRSRRVRPGMNRSAAALWRGGWAARGKAGLRGRARRERVRRLACGGPAGLAAERGVCGVDLLGKPK